MIYSFNNKKPIIGKDCLIVSNSSIAGDLIIGDKSSIWFYVSARGDDGYIRIGNNTNIQDNSVLHCSPGYPLVIGDNVTVGHSATLHGCSIDDDSLIGIGATVLNGAKIGKNCIIGAGSLVLEGKEIPDNSLVIGSPAKVIRQVNEDDIRSIRENADLYYHKSLVYRKENENI